jgi:hypothetical protein
MFPETTETDSLSLVQFSRDRVDVGALYERFNADSEHADAVFEHVALAPYGTIKDTRDQLADHD